MHLKSTNAILFPYGEGIEALRSIWPHSMWKDKMILNSAPHQFYVLPLKWKNFLISFKELFGLGSGLRGKGAAGMTRAKTEHTILHHAKVSFC